MILSKPAYYDEFRCLAGACPDSCCKEWSVQVDDFSAAMYRAMPGALGDRLRSVLTEEDGVTVMTIEDGRCPMWRQDGLCRIQAELGEDALCDVCRDFPRISHDFGDFAELQLELSCPEAARLILTSPAAPDVRWEEEDGEEPEYDPAEMEGAIRLRRELLAILADETLTPGQTLLEMYRAGTGIRCTPGGAGDLEGISAFFASLEVLTPTWPHRLRQARAGKLHPMTRNLARYLLMRYFLQGDPKDTVGKLTFITASCILVSALGGDFIESAQFFSKEIENSDCNPAALMDAAFTEAAFSGENLTALLLNS